MSNMSYCRFENTDRDLADCADALEDLSRGEGEPLSASELKAAKNLVSRCANLLSLIAEHTGVDLDLDELDGSIPEALDDMQDGAEKGAAERAEEEEREAVNAEVRRAERKAWDPNP